MSREHLAALRSLYAQFAAGNMWATGKLLAPDVVSSWPDPGGRVVCHGQDELRERFRALLVHWGCYRAEARRFEPLGDDVVLVVAQQYGTAERSGIEVESPIFTVWVFREGRVVGQHWALNRREALDAAGLTE